MSVLKDFGQFCSHPRQPHMTVYAERQIEDLGTFGVYWYRRPTGHTKSAARHRGETPWIIQWSYVEKAPDGSWMVSRSMSGYDSREAAIQGRGITGFNPA